jgi:hypothetical protein
VSGSDDILVVVTMWRQECLHYRIRRPPPCGGRDAYTTSFAVPPVWRQGCLHYQLRHHDCTAYPNANEDACATVLPAGCLPYLQAGCLPHLPAGCLRHLQAGCLRYLPAGCLRYQPISNFHLPASNFTGWKACATNHSASSVISVSSVVFDHRHESLCHRPQAGCLRYLPAGCLRYLPAGCLRHLQARCLPHLQAGCLRYRPISNFQLPASNFTGWKACATDHRQDACATCRQDACATCRQDACATCRQDACDTVQFPISNFQHPISQAGKPVLPTTLYPPRSPCPPWFLITGWKACATDHRQDACDTNAGRMPALLSCQQDACATCRQDACATCRQDACATVQFPISNFQHPISQAGKPVLPTTQRPQ